MKTKKLIINAICFIACLLCSTTSLAQSGTGAKGVITDEFGDPLPAASVAVMNNNKIARGTSTNIHGEFNIDIDLAGGDEELVFSYIGTKTVKKKITKELISKPIEVVLKTDDAGNFYFSISDPEIFTREFSVPVFNFDGFSEKNPHDFAIGTPVTIPSLSVEFESPVIPFSDVVYDVEVDQRNLPDAIGDIYYAEVTSEMTVAFSYDQSTMPPCKRKLRHFP